MIDIVLPRLLRLISERTDRGIATYGTMLTTDNGRRVIRDAIEENYDLLMYLLQMEQELTDIATYLHSHSQALPYDVRNELQGFIETWGNKEI